MRRSEVLLLVAALVACDASRERPTAFDQNAPAAGTSEVDRPHVVYTRKSLLLERVGVPTPTPVSTPSQPSQTTMQSDDPSTVAVDGAGMLVGMRPGSTVVRAVGGGSELLVTVLGAQALRVEPEQLELEPGAEARVRVVHEAGAEVPAEAVRWVMTPGTPVGVVKGLVLSTGTAGQFEVTAEAGGARVVLPVRVGLSGGARLTVSPPRARLRRGQVSAFQLLSARGGVRAEWSSSEPGVLVAMGGGMFQAVKAGRARVCASALDRVSCSDVEVTP